MVEKLVSTRQTLVKFSSSNSAFMRTASFPSSILPISDLFALARPMSRSTANGGAVHMRRVGNALGCAGEWRRRAPEGHEWR